MPEVRWCWNDSTWGQVHHLKNFFIFKKNHDIDLQYCGHLHILIFFCWIVNLSAGWNTICVSKLKFRLIKALWNKKSVGFVKFGIMLLTKYLLLISACIFLGFSLGSPDGECIQPPEEQMEKFLELRLTEEQLCKAKTEIKKVWISCTNKYIKVPSLYISKTDWDNMKFLTLWKCRHRNNLSLKGAKTGGMNYIEDYPEFKIIFFATQNTHYFQDYYCNLHACKMTFPFSK